MSKSNLIINEQSIRTELETYENKPYDCLFEYIWNSFDANATEVVLSFDVPTEGIGYVKNVTLKDNGDGWDFDDDAITNNFMSSTKKPKKYKTIPRGQYGRGRYSFIWIAEKIEIFSKSKKLILTHNTDIHKEKDEKVVNGTEIHFIRITDVFSDALKSESLQHALSIEFGWFLYENKGLKLIVNGFELDYRSLIKQTVEYTRHDLPEALRNEVNDDFHAEIILWNEKPSEYSKFYFLNTDNQEVFKINTGLNKKSDNFWHSVFIYSSVITDEIDMIDDENISQLVIEYRGNQRIIKRIKTFLKEELVRLRKPCLIEQSNEMLNCLKEDKIIPNLREFGIYDDNSFDDLIKTIYTISPSLFTNRSSSEKRFICATFAGLLSSYDNTLIKVVLEQLQDLTEEEKQDLLDILQRTQLSNVISTVKEIDHRLEVIEKLKVLLSDYEKETLEVKHIQKILDNNFWLFGEQFRLFSSTEGALKNVLTRYAEEILNISNPELDHKPTGEVDLFLTKTESIGEGCQRNIIVELKRASKILGKKEYDQIESYMEKIQDESLCNGDNQYWEFYLVGKDYDRRIENQIESASNHGERVRGLCSNVNGKYKIYVRKWSDILEVEWGYKMKYLKEKLQIKSQEAQNNPDEITKGLIDR